MKTLYLAGPMSGLPDFNYPAFNAAEDQLRAAGYYVLNPVRSAFMHDPPRLDLRIQTGKWEDYMRNGINQLIRCDGVVLLRGWVHSKGATIEAHIAEHLGMTALPIGYWLSKAEELAA